MNRFFLTTAEFTELGVFFYQELFSLCSLRLSGEISEFPFTTEFAEVWKLDPKPQRSDVRPQSRPQSEIPFTPYA